MKLLLQDNLFKKIISIFALIHGGEHKHAHCRHCDPETRQMVLVRAVKSGTDRKGWVG